MLGTAAYMGSGFWARAMAQAGADLSAYQKAGIDWQQAKGEAITVAVIPASYFDNLGALIPQFEALTGVKVRIEKIPPGQIRQKAVLDLSSRTGNYATHAADPMYYPLYAANGWVEPLDQYLNDSKLTDPEWFNFSDIIEAWREADSIEGKPYGIPYDGEVTLQVYRKDLYDAAGLKPAETYDEMLSNAKALTHADDRQYGLALRGFAGAGQNMYIYPSLLRGFGGKWFDGQAIQVNSPEALEALKWYVNALSHYAPSAVRNWNWPDIADAFSQGSIACYVDANTSEAVITNPTKSKVVGKVAYARWPKGPSGKRVTSIWNWGFPINAALSDAQKKATWLFITWAASAETQARTSWLFDGPAKRSGLNRISLWQSPEFAEIKKSAGDNFIQASLDSLQNDTDVEWRPRVPQWPAIGDTMAVAVQSALVGEKTAEDALNEAQARIDKILKG